MLSISNLTVEYGSTRALENASLNFPLEGYTLGVVGESGSGKTTLGNSIMRLIRPPGKIVSGKIYFNDKDVMQMTPKELRSFRWKDISMIFQSAMNALNPVKTISDHIVEVLREHSDISLSEAKVRAEELLVSMGIPANRIRNYPHEFSGGMRQRAVIAMAVALSPRLLIADEPTSALDIVVQDQILALIQEEVLKHNLSLLFITHEISLLPGLVDNVAVMYAGEIVELGPIEKVLNDPLHPYTEMLLDSLLTLSSTRDMLNRPVQRQEAGFPKEGCKYTTRCKYRMEICPRERPILTEVEKGRFVSCHKY